MPFKPFITFCKENNYYEFLPSTKAAFGSEDVDVGDNFIIFMHALDYHKSNPPNKPIFCSDSIFLKI